MIFWPHVSRLRLDSGHRPDATRRARLAAPKQSKAKAGLSRRNEVKTDDPGLIDGISLGFEVKTLDDVSYLDNFVLVQKLPMCSIAINRWRMLTLFIKFFVLYVTIGARIVRTKRTQPETRNIAMM